MPPKRKNGSGDTKSQSKKRKKAAEVESDESDFETTGNGGTFDYENNETPELDIVRQIGLREYRLRQKLTHT